MFLTIKVNYTTDRIDYVLKKTLNLKKIIKKLLLICLKIERKVYNDLTTMEKKRKIFCRKEICHSMNMKNRMIKYPYNGELVVIMR